MDEKGLLRDGQRRDPALPGAAPQVELEQPWVALFDGAPVMMSLSDVETGRFEQVNATALRLSGYRLDELIGRTSVEVGWIAAEDRARLLAALQERGRVDNLELRIRCRDGRLLDCLYQASLVTVGGRERLLSIAQDITGRKRMEDALRDSEARFRLLAESSTDMISRHAPDGTYVYASPACRALLGYAPEELVGRNAYDLVEPADVPAVRASHVRISTTPGVATTIFRARRKDGRLAWLETTSRVIRDPATMEIAEIHAATRDAGDRKRFEEELQARSRYIETVLENAPIGFAVYGIADRQTRYVSAHFEATYGLPRGSVKDVDGFYEAVERDPARRAAMRARVEADLASGDPSRMRWEDVPIRGAGGATRYVTATNIPVYDQGVMVATVQDVTARVRAQEALGESEALLRSTVERAPIVLFTLDLDGVFRLSTGAGLKGLGLQPGQVVGLSLFEVYRDYPEVLENFRQALKGEPIVFITEIGSLTFEVRYAPLLDSSGRMKGVVGTAIDLTARRQAEAEHARLQALLIQAQKMEAVGQLAGGVAHDFNNILTAILANVDLLQLDAGLSEPARASLREVEDDARRAASLTRQLLLFSRRQPMQRRAVDLGALVENLLRMLHRLIGEHVALELVAGQGALYLEADGGMLEQAVTNLVVNARDAMPGGGRVVLRLGALALDGAAAEARHPEARPGRFASVEVSDTGHGMDPETAAHIFEPFFTTKGVGRGTGLGLATVHGIVKQHQGWVEVETAVGRGTTFRMMLPMAPGVLAAPAAHPAAAPVRPVGERERLLVVEDDPSVRRTVVRMLERLGYRVAAASHAAEALARWDAEAGRFDLVLSDVVMPGMNGVALARRLRQLRPGLRVILMSGYSADLGEAEDLRRAGVPILAKPLDGGVLARIVRELLDAPAPGA